MISVDEFHARSNQDAFIMLAKARVARINLLNQVADGCALRYLDIQIAPSDRVTQLRVE